MGIRCPIPIRSTGMNLSLARLPFQQSAPVKGGVVAFGGFAASRTEVPSPTKRRPSAICSTGLAWVVARTALPAPWQQPSLCWYADGSAPFRTRQCRQTRLAPYARLVRLYRPMAHRLTEALPRPRSASRQYRVDPWLSKKVDQAGSRPRRLQPETSRADAPAQAGRAWHRTSSLRRSAGNRLGLVRHVAAANPDHRSNTCIAR